MNLRVIKKEIEYCVGAFIDDCTVFVALNPGCDTDEVNAIADEAVELYNSLRDKVNNLPEELRHKTSPKHQHRDKAEIAAEKADLRKKLNAYYDGIRKELLDKLDGLNGKLSEAITHKAPKKPVEKPAPAKKAPAKKTAAEKVEEVAEKPAETAVEVKAEEKPAKKAPAKKTAPKAAAEKTPAKKAAPKATTEKAPAKKTATKATAEKSPAKKATPKADAEKTPAKKPAAKKAPAKKAEE